MTHPLPEQPLLCPFCGEKPEVHIAGHRAVLGNPGQRSVECINSDCPLYGDRFAWDAWNRRSPSAPDGQTHYDGCWRERGHHACAIAELVRRSSRGETTPTCDCDTLRERLAVMREEQRGIAALFGIGPCREDRPATWTDGLRGWHTLLDAMWPVAKKLEAYELAEDRARGETAPPLIARAGISAAIRRVTGCPDLKAGELSLADEVLKEAVSVERLVEEIVTALANLPRNEIKPYNALSDWLLPLEVTHAELLGTIEGILLRSSSSPSRDTPGPDWHDNKGLVSTYHGPVGGDTEKGVVVRRCVGDTVEVRPEKGPAARLSLDDAQALAYSLLDFAIRPYAGDIARRAIDAAMGQSLPESPTPDIPLHELHGKPPRPATKEPGNG